MWAVQIGFLSMGRNLVICSKEQRKESNDTVKKHKKYCLNERLL